MLRILQHDRYYADQDISEQDWSRSAPLRCEPNCAWLALEDLPVRAEFRDHRVTYRREGWRTEIPTEVVIPIGSDEPQRGVDGGRLAGPIGDPNSCRCDKCISLPQSKTRGATERNNFERIIEVRRCFRTAEQKKPARI